VNLTPLWSLAERWRSEADLFRRRSREGDAHLIESFALELEGALREWGLEKLTLHQAAHETGLTYDTLQKRVSKGRLPNAGGGGSPRVRRGDLYGVRTHRHPGTSKGGPDLAAEALLRRKVK